MRARRSSPRSSPRSPESWGSNSRLTRPRWRTSHGQRGPGANQAIVARRDHGHPDAPVVLEATDHLLKNRGEIPTIVFSRLGTSFTGHLQTARKLPKVCVAATDGLGWLRHGMRMFKTMADMEKSRLCIITGEKAFDRKLDVIGTTLHYIPLNRWVDEINQTETTDEMRALADYYTKQAKEIREPTSEDILNAAKTYFVAKRIMAAENCDGISLNCLDLVRHHPDPLPSVHRLVQAQRRGERGRLRSGLERGHLHALVACCSSGPASCRTRRPIRSITP